MLCKLSFSKIFSVPGTMYLFERSGSKGLGWGWAVHIASIAVAGLGLKMVIYSGLTNVKCSDLCQPLNFHRMAVL